MKLLPGPEGQVFYLPPNGIFFLSPPLSRFSGLLSAALLKIRKLNLLKKSFT
jgi:hypothetical protein